MSSILKHWRESATLLLVAKSRIPVVSKYQSTNFEVLMLKRSGKSKFMPKLHVFPGGVSDDADFSPKWMELFSQTGIDVVTGLNRFFQRGGPGGPMFSRTRPSEFSKIPSELAFRICAIRETFEESGILLVRDINTVKNEKLNMSSQPMSGKSSILSDSILKPWRKLVDSDAYQFISMCEELEVVPDVWSLYEWSNWLTPIVPNKEQKITKEKFRGRRYDTAFYLCVLDYVPNAIHDDKETTELEWASSGQYFEKHKSSTLQLAPPQVVELGRVQNFTDAEKLKLFAYERSATRALQTFPVLCACDNAILFLYPGDDLYPEYPDFDGEKTPLSIEGTKEKLRQTYPNMNRSEMFTGSDSHMVRNYQCNIQLADRQVTPLFDEINTVDTQSRL